MTYILTLYVVGIQSASTLMSLPYPSLDECRAAGAAWVLASPRNSYTCEAKK